jgi:hypothetical protein
MPTLLRWSFRGWRNSIGHPRRSGEKKSKRLSGITSLVREKRPSGGAARRIRIDPSDAVSPGRCKKNPPIG